MHIDVDLARIKRHEQRHNRMTVARQIVGIGGTHDADQELVAHRPSVDEQILPERIGAGMRGQRGKAFDRNAVALTLHRDRVGAEFRSENIGEARKTPGRAGQCRGPGRGHALLASEREGDVGPAHGETTHDLADRFAFGAVGLEKFQPRRRRVEQVAHLDTRAFAERGGLDLGFVAGVDRDAPGMRLAPVAGGDRQPCDRADRGQRLAAEAQRPDVHEIVVGELGGSVALDAQRKVGARHAVAVVAHADEPAPAAVGHDLNLARAGVERVFDELLHDARRPLDHFAGGDAVDGGFGQLADGHGFGPANSDGQLYRDRHCAARR